MSVTKEHYHDQVEAGQREANEHPILFSTPMVQAILEGRKTQTRRIVKNNPRIASALEKTCEYFSKNKTLRESYCPYGQPGDLLWVRESFAKAVDGWLFKATPKEQQFVSKWKPSIHMPKATARIWLEVEEIKVERLQDISEEDCIAEGVRYPVHDGKVSLKLGVENSAINFLPNVKLDSQWTSKELLFAHWAELWCNVNDRESWDVNPWVWVIKFKVLSTTGKPSFDYAQDDKLPDNSVNQ